MISAGFFLPKILEDLNLKKIWIEHRTVLAIEKVTIMSSACWMNTKATQKIDK
jgi:hypothetical protein